MGHVVYCRQGRNAYKYLHSDGRSIACPCVILNVEQIARRVFQIFRLFMPNFLCNLSWVWFEWWRVKWWRCRFWCCRKTRLFSLLFIMTRA
jgi:hypothetical protein